MSSMDIQPYTTLIVDPNAALRRAAAARIAEMCAVYEADSLAEARGFLETTPVHVVMTRDLLADGAGTELCAFAVRHSPSTIRVLYSDTPTLETALAAINDGEVWRFLSPASTAEALCETAAEALAAFVALGGDSVLIEELRTERDSLERRVEQRTRELVALNEELRIALDQLHALLVRDELTGLYNRRMMLERIDEEYRKARRYQTPISCLVLDIPNFKDFSIDYGHEIGELLLQEVADRVRSHVRDVDIACRSGSQEFVLILPHTSALQAIVVAERMQRVIADAPFELEGTTIAIPVCMGIADITPAVASGSELLSRAEEAERAIRAAGVSPAIGTYHEDDVLATR